MTAQQLRSSWAVAVVLVLAAALAVVAVAGSADVGSPDVPCLQNKWNRTTGECFITNVCNITMYGYALCDRDVSMCGSSKVDGVAMCGHSSFFIGYCQQQCQGLTWEQTNSTKCETNGKCCPPRTVC